MSKIKVAILGSTGSIGEQALEIVQENPGRFEVVALASGGSSECSRKRFDEQCQENLSPQCFDNRALSEVEGLDAVVNLADKSHTGADVVLNGIAGNVGLRPSLRAIESGARLALANKESLVVGGSLIRSLALAPGASAGEVLSGDRPCTGPERLGPEHGLWPSQDDGVGEADGGGQTKDLLDIISPVDSEHSAIWQSLPLPHYNSSIDKLVLTASGGPFRGMKAEQLKDVTPEQALDHPTWKMGPLVTINSSTLMNKALELIEAVYLFGVSPDQVQAVVHPQSIVHSGVQFKDGANIWQASPPSMKLPIALGVNSLTRVPSRLDNSVIPHIDWQTSLNLDFEPIDESTFPALKIAVDCLKAGPLYPAFMNAVNEKNVYLFLEGEIEYLEIMSILQDKLSSFNPGEFACDPMNPTLNEIENLIEVVSNC
jgi:1-deoxy-D-xylulose-5-phosphate reductoisomerase